MSFRKCQLLSHDERQIYSVDDEFTLRETKRAIARCANDEWIEGWEHLKNGCDSFDMGAAVGYSAVIGSMKMLRAARRMGTKHVSDRKMRKAMLMAAFRGFIPGMCMIKSMNPMTIAISGYNSIVPESAKAIWLLNKWRKSMVGDPRFPKLSDKKIRRVLNDLLTIGASEDSLWRMKIARKLGATNLLTCLQASPPDSRAELLTLEWWVEERKKMRGKPWARRVLSDMRLLIETRFPLQAQILSEVQPSSKNATHASVLT